MDFELHNVCGKAVLNGREVLQRIPESVRVKLNEGAQQMAWHTPGVEIRFVWDWEEAATITLAASVGVCNSTGALAVPFCGAFQAGPPVFIGEEPVTLSLLPHARFRNLDFAATPGASAAFSPRVGRIMLLGGPVSVLAVSGREMRAPLSSERPAIRYAAYGSSITHGIYASAPHLTYPSRIARAMGWDLVNLGFRGSAAADAAMADYLAEEVQWDILTIEASVNTVAIFTPEQFFERWQSFLERIVRARPDRPIVVLNMFLHFRDLPAYARLENEGQDAEALRESIRCILRDLNAPNVTLLENDVLLRDAFGLTADVLHPGDDGFERIANGVLGYFQAHAPAFLAGR